MIHTDCGLHHKVFAKRKKEMFCPSASLYSFKYPTGSISTLNLHPQAADAGSWLAVFSKIIVFCFASYPSFPLLLPTNQRNKPISRMIWFTDQWAIRPRVSPLRFKEPVSVIACKSCAWREHMAWEARSFFLFFFMRPDACVRCKVSFRLSDPGVSCKWSSWLAKMQRSSSTGLSGAWPAYHVCSTRSKVCVFFNEKSKKSCEDEGNILCLERYLVCDFGMFDKLGVSKEKPQSTAFKTLSTSDRTQQNFSCPFSFLTGLEGRR